MKKSRSKHQPGSSEMLELKTEMKEGIEKLYDYPHIKRLNRNLRKIFMQYLTHESNSLPPDAEEIFADLFVLHEFLDAVEDRGMPG